MNTGVIRNFFTQVDRYLDMGFTFLTVMGGAIVALTVVLQVLLRYVFKQPLFGLEEFSRLVAIWVYFLGAIFCTRSDAHVQGDIAGRLFPETKTRGVVKVIVWLLSLLACLLFLYHSGNYSIWLYQTGERTTGLWWPRITSVGSMTFGAFFMTIYCIVNIIKYLNQAVTGPPSSFDGGGAV